ncbi:short chain dehydrogenase/reductase family protein-like protein [Pseudovirgaria hyperparasitica]|uniref:Short chain dehydrogenase/reductase family protein-like protein n=1 Tax=Pseudovirgaria hyperparasitica TaxID=470096 RepID=A0A6A6VZ52_9PEZI|nr:short chain dehydrogenase/reductase family protein-like protein [Pseudovirgaria hyperparasitica]KAF2755573.1 short chain dehydrogenase/reductase family protein-like protein [Pseudovirgaria hyperparasitica]
MTTSSAAAASSKPPRPRSPHFPPHNAPRVWLLVHGTSPINIALARKVIEYGDYVVAGVLPVEYERDEERMSEFKEFLEEAKRTERWRERLRVVGLDARVMGQCQAAVAEAVEAFGRIDVLLGSTSEAVVGTIEELAQSARTQAVARDQFEINFFANVNIIKAVLPSMREKKNGHIIMLTAITSHLGTPGLGLYCSSQWAIEGYCDSIAYEIAPFNIKVTIVQPNFEITVLTNRITSVPPMPEYSPDVNPAPLSRELLSGILDRLEGSKGAVATPTEDSTAMADDAPSPASTVHNPTLGDQLSTENVTSLYPPLVPSFKDPLIAETVHALTAIGGHDNPPARHIVGLEGVMAVKEKLKTVSEELEDFIEVSNAVDITKDEETLG